MNNIGWRPATKEEIRQHMKLEDERLLDYAERARVCYMSEDGESFLLDNMERFQSILLTKIIREL